jgi:GAF domain-containing protein
LRRDEDQKPWTADDYRLAEDAVNGISQALENARLFAEIQRRAQVERTIGEVTARAQASLDLETLMKTVVREVALATSAAKVQIRLGEADAVSLGDSAEEVAVG